MASRKPVAGSSPGGSAGQLHMHPVAGGEASTLELAGELDLASAPALESCLEELCASAREVVIDLSRVSFADSTGLAVLMRTQDAPCPVRVTGMPARLARIVELLGCADRPPFAPPA